MSHLRNKKGRKSKMKTLHIAAAVFGALVLASGCSTTRTRVIAGGETKEAVAGFSTDDLEKTAMESIEYMNRAIMRFHVEGARVVVNVKPFKIDTYARGSDAERIANDFEAILKEEMTNGGTFIIYNPEAAASVAAAGQQPPLPEYVLDGTIQQRNERLDSGDVYQSFSVLLKISATVYHHNPAQRGLEVWQKRIPLSKLVDKSRALR